jgi:hypothetical protein
VTGSNIHTIRRITRSCSLRCRSISSGLGDLRLILLTLGVVVAFYALFLAFEEQTVAVTPLMRCSVRTLRPPCRDGLFFHAAVPARVCPMPFNRGSEFIHADSELGATSLAIVKCLTSGLRKESRRFLLLRV